MVNETPMVNKTPLQQYNLHNELKTMFSLLHWKGIPLVTIDMGFDYLLLKVACKLLVSLNNIAGIHNTSCDALRI